MKPSTLLDIKTRIRKFSDLYKVLIKLWNGNVPHGNAATYPHTILIGVILSNMSLISTGCVGYNHAKDVADFKKNLETLRKINEYENKCYMSHYAWNEVDSIYMSELHMEDMENESELNALESQSFEC